MTFFLYPVVTIEADTESEATDALLEAIFDAGVGEIPGWLPEPPDAELARLIAAAPDLLAAVEGLVVFIDIVRGNRPALKAAANLGRTVIKQAKGE